MVDDPMIDATCAVQYPAGKPNPFFVEAGQRKVEKPALTEG
jgi:hypothetical protein